MIEGKPTSLPPIVMLISVVDELRDDSWLLITSVVFAPEQAAKANDAGELADAHCGPYALGLWSQEPLSLPAPVPDE
jgi:hypothetical protein